MDGPACGAEGCAQRSVLGSLLLQSRGVAVIALGYIPHFKHMHLAFRLIQARAEALTNVA